MVHKIKETELTYYCDNKRHLVCLPYSIENLHKMAEDLAIDKCWFHKDHYDIPKRRVKDIQSQCDVVCSNRDILFIIKNNRSPFPEIGIRESHALNHPTKLNEYPLTPKECYSKNNNNSK